MRVQWGFRLSVVSVAGAIALGACGADPGATVISASQEDSGGELAFGLRSCGPRVLNPTADPSFYRDEPIYLANEQPTDEVRSWAQSRPGYQDIWIDSDHNRWIAVGFSREVEERQRELEEEFPGVGVVAVEVRTNSAELKSLRKEVEDALASSEISNWSLSDSIISGTVEVMVPVADEGTLAVLAPFAGPMLCVGGTDPADAVPDQAQPTQGDGWRLLGTEKTGPDYRTGVATNVDQYDRLWVEVGLTSHAPDVDFENEIVIWFGAVFGSGCPIRLDDVVTDQTERLVHGDFVLPGNPSVCYLDANPEAYLVAVERNRLPEAPFTVQLGAEHVGLQERTKVLVDLRPPGTVAAANDLVVDDTPPMAELLEPGLFIETGFPWEVTVDLSCSLEAIGPVNDTMWRPESNALANGVPPAWREGSDQGLVEGELFLSMEPAQLTVTVNGDAVVYEPIPASESATMTCT